MAYRKEISLGEGNLVLESGELAKQADGSCVARLGDTMVLTTACAVRKEGAMRPFLPLTVDYREYSYAAGRIPGGFFKREGRPTEKEIITCRLIDRPIRPLFPKGYGYETQIVSIVLSADGENDPDILAINGASTALVLSDIPFYNPIGAVRVGLIDGNLVLNPRSSEREISDLDLIVVGTEDAIAMVEAGANQLSEDQILDAIFFAHQELQQVIGAQKQLFQEMSLSKPEWQSPEKYSAELHAEVRSAVFDGLNTALHTKGKMDRKDKVSAVKSGYLATIAEDDTDRRSQVEAIFENLEEIILRDEVLNIGKRFDGRALDEIRPLSTNVGILPRAHGSAVFTRGETQALVNATLGTGRDAQIIEEYEGEHLNKFILHYSFPPFSVGEVKFLRGPGRREIGHGVLARRALHPMLPAEDDFPYTMRIVSEILESNGSSSMATVCGGSLALFDAGVPMLAPVAGVAMGLIKEGEKFAVLSDIAGQEDHFGDMDFKVAGTRKGITALQMDIKIAGVDRNIMGTALEQAHRGRHHILDHMEKAISAPRDDISQFAPRLHTIFVHTDKIRDIIGPGGKTIRALSQETGCEIDVDNDGKVVVAAPHGAAFKRAIEMIERLTEVPEIGKVYTGPVRRVEAYGAFVEILPGTDGLLHISELAPYRVREVEDILKEGDEVTVKVIDIDPENRKLRLSRKAVIMEAPDYDPSKYEGMDAEPSNDNRDSRSRDRSDRRGRPPGRGGSRGRR